MKTVPGGSPDPSTKLGPRTLGARHLELIERVEAAARAVEVAEADLVDAVRASVTAGDSWAVIGTALGISRQAAQKRFGKDWTPPPRPKAPKSTDFLQAPAFDRDDALLRQREAVTVLHGDPGARDRLYGDGLDDEIDDGYDGAPGSAATSR